MKYREGLPPDMPAGIAKLPVHRGYPVPWFVAGKEHGLDDWDFRMVAPGRVAQAVKFEQCWVCGKPLLFGLRAYVAGPMCGVNRNSAEPPNHVSCADWSARACPFLTRPHARRREAGMPDGGEMAPGGILRNPGVAMVWITNKTILKPRGEHTYFDIGVPSEVRWYSEGRKATYEEVMESVRTGLPILAEQCASHEERALLHQYLTRFLTYLPSEEVPA